MEQQFNHINDDLLVKYLLGEASAGEEQAVLDWIAANAENQKYFGQFKLIWDTSKQLASDSKADENKAWERFQQRVKNGGHMVDKKKTRNISWMRVAAAVILIIGLSITGFVIFNKINTAKELLILADQQVIKDTLPDGSMVTLNKKSSISYPSKFKGNSRNVVLKGEAFFNVTPNKKKPFIIRANDVEITVVGTSFNVKSINGTTEVIVETGIVRVTKDGKTVELKAGERTIVSAGTAPPKEEVTDKLYNYYRTHEFACDDTPLWRLVEVVNEAYNVHIVFGREELKNQTLTTTFYNESLDQVLEVIKLTFNIKVTKRGDQIILE